MKEIIGLLIFIVIFTVTVFLYVDKKINKEFAYFLLVFSVVAGFLAANYDVIKKLKWGNFELETIKKEIKSLGMAVNQSLQLKQTISTTVNNIVRVEKEIANLKDIIHQHYAAFETEEFRKADLGKRIVVYPSPLNPNNNSVIFFELQKIPEENSIQITNEVGTNAPMISFSVISNIVVLNKGDQTPDKILPSNKEFYVVKYIPDTISDKKLVTTQDVQMAVEGDRLRLTLRNK